MCAQITEKMTKLQFQNYDHSLGFRFFVHARSVFDLLLFVFGFFSFFVVKPAIFEILIIYYSEPKTERSDLKQNAFFRLLCLS